MTRHHTHPSAQCECPTCELEHACEADTRLEFAVNPHSGTIVTCYPTTNDQWVVLVLNHHPSGRTLTGWRQYARFADACETFFINADHQPARKP